MVRVSLTVALVAVALVAVWSLLSCRQDPEVRSNLVASGADTTGFMRADGPRSFEFPADHGPHAGFQTEWWYYTGNLETSSGRSFGYQLTFFRRALTPPDEHADRPSDWATNQVYMAHFAVTDVARDEHHAFERFSRGVAGLAGAQSPPYRVWLEDWHVERVGDDPAIVTMVAEEEGVGMELRLVDLKGPILQGDQGYSQKGPDPGNASYYYSQTRLESQGNVHIAGTTFDVVGLSWMDHEFSTSALAPDQVGWDWFALQFDDGSELMVFQIRTTDGSVDPFSSGTLIQPDGAIQRLASDDFTIEVRDTWRSPRSGARYPSRWTVRVPGGDLALEIVPYILDQELNVSYNYWEGAVRIEGERAGQPTTGAGYVEMTGYAGSMQEQF